MAEKVKVLVSKLEHLNSWDPHGEKKEPDPTSCPLTSTAPNTRSYTVKSVKG